MSVTPVESPCTTPTAVFPSSERPLLPSLSLNPRKHPTQDEGGTNAAAATRPLMLPSRHAPSRHQKHLIRTAPRVPDVLGGRTEATRGVTQAATGPRLPVCRLRMRPSKDAEARTPVQRVSFLPPPAAPKQLLDETPQQQEPCPTQVVIPLKDIPANLLFPDIPTRSSTTTTTKRKFMLKPKKPLMLASSYQPQLVAGTS